MSIVRETVTMSVSDHYRLLQEERDAAAEDYAALFDDKNKWRDAYIEMMHEKWRHESRADELEQTVLDLQVVIADLEVQLESCKRGMGA